MYHFQPRLDKKTIVDLLKKIHLEPSIIQLLGKMRVKSDGSNTLKSFLQKYRKALIASIHPDQFGQEDTKEWNLANSLITEVEQHFYNVHSTLGDEHPQQLAIILRSRKKREPKNPIENTLIEDDPIKMQDMLYGEYYHELFNTYSNTELNLLFNNKIEVGMRINHKLQFTLIYENKQYDWENYSIIGSVRRPTVYEKIKSLLETNNKTKVQLHGSYEALAEGDITALNLLTISKQDAFAIKLYKDLKPNLEVGHFILAKNDQDGSIKFIGQYRAYNDA